MAAMLEPSTARDRIAGEALKMQSELFWFKVVSLILPFFFFFFIFFPIVLTLFSWMFQVILHQRKLVHSV
jgi:hypothetical protein